MEFENELESYIADAVLLNAVKTDLTQKLENSAQLIKTNDDRAQAKIADLDSKLWKAQEEVTEMKASVQAVPELQAANADLTKQVEISKEVIQTLETNAAEAIQKNEANAAEAAEAAEAFQTLQASAAEAAKHAEVSLLHCPPLLCMQLSSETVH